MSALPSDTATANGRRAELRDRPDMAELLKATAETMAAVKTATARLEGELSALRSLPRRKPASTGA